MSRRVTRKQRAVRSRQRGRSVGRRRCRRVSRRCLRKVGAKKVGARRMKASVRRRVVGRRRGVCRGGMGPYLLYTFYAEKQGRNFPYNWRRRYFKLYSNNKIEYYVGENTGYKGKFEFIKGVIDGTILNIKSNKDRIYKLRFITDLRIIVYTDDSQIPLTVVSVDENSSFTQCSAHYSYKTYTYTFTFSNNTVITVDYKENQEVSPNYNNSYPQKFILEFPPDVSKQQRLALETYLEDNNETIESHKIEFRFILRYLPITGTYSQSLVRLSNILNAQAQQQVLMAAPVTQSVAAPGQPVPTAAPVTQSVAVQPVPIAVEQHPVTNDFTKYVIKKDNYHNILNLKWNEVEIMNLDNETVRKGKLQLASFDSDTNKWTFKIFSDTEIISINEGDGYSIQRTS